MRLVFAGTPDFARIALQALLAAGHEVPLVLTQPDRPAGRGLKLTPSPVKQAALDVGIEVAQPRSLRLDGKYPDEAAAARELLERVAPDVMVVAAYGLILPQWTLQLPRLGCLNIHASLLPRWRGAAPIQRAIEAGDAQTGVTIMQMDEGLDTGDMLLERVVPIGAQQTAAELHDVLADEGGKAIVEALAALPGLTPKRQPSEGVTYAAKLDKAEAALDCTQPAELLARRVRAFNPVPGATLRLPGLADPVKVWKAQALPGGAGEPGRVLGVSESGIDIATGEGVLRLQELQKAGGKRQPVDVFVRGWQPA
jgi:methionyl-tRNA formyltransferase